MKEFYDLDSRRRCAGSEIAQSHELSLRMMSVSPGDVVLDIGCGGGALLSEINRRKGIAVGLDISETQIRYTKTHSRDALLIIGDADRLPLKNSVFTKCFAVEILEHVQNPGLMMKEIRRILEDDGELIIVVPNDRNWFIHRVMQGYFREAFYDYGHLYNLSSMEKIDPLLKGFKIIMVRKNNIPTIPMLGIISILFRGLCKILKINKVIYVKRSIIYSSYSLMSSIAPKLTLHLIIKLKKIVF